MSVPALSFRSFLRLSWSFARTMLKRLFVRRSELPQFVANYRPDGMLDTLPTEVPTLTEVGRCIGCGACDVRAMELDAFDALGARGPMAFVVAASRSAATDVPRGERVTDALLESLTRVCPVRVPFVPLVALVRRRHEALTAVKALPAAT